MARVRAGTIAVLVVSLPVLAGIFFYGPFALDLFLHRRPPSRFLIPSGYVGWVRVEYRVAGAPPLPREGKYLLVRVGTGGSLHTSSDLPGGWARDQFFYYSGNARQALSSAGWCKGGMIWGEVTVRDEKAVVVQKFFVGNEDQFRAEMDPAGKTYSPCG
ncbi:MAG: hypothetical protein WA628_20325 [Terriglobales bacterium]